MSRPPRHGARLIDTTPRLGALGTLVALLAPLLIFWNTD
jgi:hypothetical protein